MEDSIVIRARFVDFGFASALFVITSCGNLVTDDASSSNSYGAERGDSGSGAASGGGVMSMDGELVDTGALPEYAPCTDTLPTDPDAGDAAVEIELGAGDLTLLVVFDKSTSMDWFWDHRTRWQAASDAMVAGMAPYLDNLTIGAILFPQLAECSSAPLTHEVQIDYAPGHEFMATWLARVCWPKTAWGTPLERAFDFADQAISDASELGLLQDRFRVMVVTDGEPNCGDSPERLVQYAASWRQLGVETYVLGLPGSQQAAELLDAIALAGGTEQHQSPGDPTELQRAVDVIAK
jgi:hypothetical protein